MAGINTSDNAMAAVEPDTTDRYRNCLLRPMGRNGDDPVRLEHVVDAALVGAVAFASIVLVDVIPTLLTGDPNFLTPAQIMARVPTAAVAALLAFAAMWARGRGLNAIAVLREMWGGSGE